MSSLVARYSNTGDGMCHPCFTYDPRNRHDRWGVYNLFLGLTRLRQATGIDAMVVEVPSPLRGKLLVWAFTGTLLTAYTVFLMLFRWFPST